MYKIRLSPFADIFYTEWLLNRDSFRYNLVIDQVLYGELDVDRLKNALKKYIGDHVVINSHIQEINGKPYWVKNEDIIELEYSNHPINSDELFKYITNRFDLHRGPLYRFKLVKIKDKEHRFIIVMHHLLMDGSAALDDGVFKTISNYYNNEDYKNAGSLDEQIKLLTNLTENLSTNLEQNRDEYQKFWQQKLSDVSNIDLTFLKLNQNNKTSAVKAIKFNFGATEATKLKQINHKYQITTYIYSQIIFALLLHKYSGLERLAISYPMAIKEGLDFIYGAQINTNFAPYQFAKTTTIIELLEQSRDFFKLTAKNIVKYGYYPITDLIHAGNNKDLLNICFAQTFFRDKPFAFAGIDKVEVPEEFILDFVPPDLLLLEQNPRDKELNHRLIYDESSFAKDLLVNFVDCYKKLFLEILDDLLVGNAGKPISSYCLLDAKQYHKIVYEFNKTAKAYPNDKTIHQLFEEQVLKTPDNIAVVYEDKKLTYQELNNQANQLANYLLKNYEIKPDNLIALILNRSEYMIIAILAVLKTGAAYVPISPDYPDERIKYILDDTKTKIAINDNCFKKKFFLY